MLCYLQLSLFSQKLSCHLPPFLTPLEQKVSKKSLFQPETPFIIFFNYHIEWNQWYISYCTGYCHPQILNNHLKIVFWLHYSLKKKKWSKIWDWKKNLPHKYIDSPSWKSSNWSDQTQTFHQIFCLFIYLKSDLHFSTVLILLFPLNGRICYKYFTKYHTRPLPNTGFL